MEGRWLRTLPRRGPRARRARTADRMSARRYRSTRRADVSSAACARPARRHARWVAADANRCATKSFLSGVGELHVLVDLAVHSGGPHFHDVLIVAHDRDFLVDAMGLSG